MNDNSLNSNNDSIRRLMSAAMEPIVLNDDDIDLQLRSANEATAIGDEQVQRIVDKVSRLIDAACIAEVTSKSTTANTTVNTTASSRITLNGTTPRLVSVSITDLPPRSNRKAAIASLLASLLALVSVVVLTANTPVQRTISHSDNVNGNSKLLRADLMRRQAMPLASRYQMTAKPLIESPVSVRVAVGDEISTGEFERRRVTLPDGSVLFVNSRSQVKIATKRRVEVSQGEVFVEVVPDFDESESRKFEVVTPKRTITALGTKFAVKLNDEETDVMVTQGKVQISGVEEVLSAGRQLQVAGEKILTTVPSASAQLEWTRDLMAAATGPLVAKSEYSGGALVTVDPNGQSSKLSLRNYHIDVHIEDGFARTTIDQTYFNHTHARLEGMFHFPLPTDASLSRLAMYVNGKLMEGGMAERDHARNTFEEIKRKMLDPALLEWVDGSTFKMRVFPLEPRQEKRIILSYSQRLPSSDGQLSYRFPAGHTMDAVQDWSAHVIVKDAAGGEWRSQSHAMTANNVGGDLVLDAALKNALLDKDFVLRVAENTNSESQISHYKHDGQQYLMLRLRPDLAGDMHRKPHRWVFLFEHAGDRTPLLARTQIEIIRTLLENAEHSDTFSIVTASSRAALYADEPQLCTAENVAAAVKYLETVHLVGALDLAAGLNASSRASALQGDAGELGGLTPYRSPVVVHVGSGMPALGERDTAKLAELIPLDAQYIGIGVGGRWNESMMKHAASRTGGLWTQINPDEEITWRAFDVFNKLNLPRLVNVKCRTGLQTRPDTNSLKQDGQDGSGNPSYETHFLLFSDIIAQGEELAAICRIPEGQPLPKEITVTATLNGQPWTQTISVENVKDQAAYLPRHWAKLEIDRLLAEDAQKNKDAIIALSKSMYVMSPYTSLLVLENEEMYTQFNVDRGRKDHWALYACPEKIEIASEVDLPERKVAEIHLRKMDPTSGVAMLRSVFDSKSTVIPTISTIPSTNGIRFEGDAFQIQQFTKIMSDLGESGQVDIRSSVAAETSQDVLSSIALLRRPEWISRQRQQRVRRYGFRPLTSWRYDYNWNGLPPHYPYYTGRGPLDFFSSQPDQTDKFWDRQHSGSDVSWFLSGRNADNDIDGIRDGYWIESNPALPKLAFPNNTNGVVASTPQQDFRTMVEKRREFDRNQFDNMAVDQLVTRLYPVDDLSLAPIGLRDLNGDFTARVSVDFDFHVQDMSSDGLAAFRSKVHMQNESLIASLGREFRLGSNTHPNDDDLWHPGRSEGTLGGRNANALQQLAERRFDIHPIPSFDGRVLVQEERDRVAATESRFAIGRFAKSIQFGSVGILPGDLADPRRIRRGQSRLRSNAVTRDRLTIDSKKQLEHRWSASALQNTNELVALPTFHTPTSNTLVANPAMFGDLLSHAPGLNTSTADVMAVVEAECDSRVSNLKSKISNPPAGNVDDAARLLIEKARSRGWESIVLPGGDGEAGVTVLYDGQGRHVWERVVSEGLREHVVCDGEMLWHVYREIGLASKRTFSQFHHREFSKFVPWLLLRVEELALGADVVALDERTVAIRRTGLQTRHDTNNLKPDGLDGSGDPSYEDANELHLVFADDGRLAERRIVERDTGKVLRRISYADDGSVTVLDGDDKEMLAAKFTRSIAAAPLLTPDLSGLVVLPMPIRTPQHVGRSVADRQPLTSPQQTAPTTESSDNVGPDADRGQDGQRAGRSVPDRQPSASQRQSSVDDPGNDAGAKQGESGPDADLGQVGQQDEDHAISLMLAYMANGNGARVVEIARTRFIDKGDTRDGLYVLLSRFPMALVQAAMPGNGESQSTPGLTPPGSPGFDLRPPVEGSPLKQFVRQYVNWLRDAAAWQPGVGGISAFQIDGPADSFVQRLSTARNHYVRWLSDEATKDRTQAQVQQEVERTLEFVTTCRTTETGWTLMNVMRPRLTTPEHLAAFAKAAERFEQHPQVGSLVRRERMTALFEALQYDEGFALFAEWLDAHLRQGVVPPIGPELYRACSVTHGQPKLDELLMKDARQLADAQMLMTLNSLAVQMRELGNTKVADQMMTLLLASLNTKHRPDVSLFAIEHLRQMKDSRADKLLDQVMELPMANQIPELWRFASKLANESGRKRLAAERLERAIMLEFANCPNTINIETVRSDYAELLAKYDELITAAATLEVAPPDGLSASIIQAADQWRTLDEDDTTACQSAARLLAKLNRTDLAWDYLVTPLAESSGESAPWIALARHLGNDKQIDLADMAWSRAFEFETTNPEILLDHAILLQSAGRTAQAKAVLKSVADGTWQPRFSATIQKIKELLQAM